MMDELLGMCCWESFYIPLFTAFLKVDYRMPVGLVDKDEVGPCKEMWGAVYITEKTGRKTFARAELMDLPDGKPVEGPNGTEVDESVSPYGKNGVPEKCAVRVEANGLWIDMKGTPKENVDKI